MIDKVITLERAEFLYPETLAFDEDGVLPMDAGLRQLARDLRPIGAIQASDLLFACAKVWHRLAHARMEGE